MSSIQTYLQTKGKKPKNVMCCGGGDFGDEMTFSAIQGSGCKNNYEICNLHDILHKICANVSLLHEHFNIIFFGIDSNSSLKYIVTTKECNVVQYCICPLCANGVSYIPILLTYKLLIE